jgi:general nucleoside transport system ATP-binding protein
MLELLDIHKHFGPVRANDGVTMRVEDGTIHGLLGENGAGKSTLMKVLTGFISADSGEILLGGERLEVSNPKESVAAGIGLLHQDPLLCLPFSVLENFMLGRPGKTLLDPDAARAELEEMAERFEFQFSADATARSLTVGERQQLEIMRLLSLGVRVLILDEPTTAISASQRVLLFATLRKLAAEGLTVIFVSHKLEEVEEICDRVTILRAGKVTGDVELPVPAAQLVALMFGKNIIPEERPAVPIGASVLELRNVTAAERLVTLEDVSLEVGSGEVVGLAGLAGSGQRTMLRVCAGHRKPDSGVVLLDGTDITNAGYNDHMDAGIHWLPADRLGQGLVEGLTITEHFALAGDTPQGFIVDWSGAAEEAKTKITHFSVKGTVASTPESLSGGNQQRLLLAMMPDHIKVLLMEHPTRGLDIESAEWVWRQILARRNDATAIVFSSADLDELLRYSDRILVFFAGRVLKELVSSETDTEELGYLIGGKERQ